MAIIWIIFLSLFFPFLWFYYFYRKDSNPEPKAWLLFAFFLGALATLPSYYFQTRLADFGIDTKGSFTLHHFLSAFIEEFFKFLFIWFFIFRKEIFDEPVDAIVYLTASASGFATIENLSVYLSHLQTNIFFNQWFLGFLRFTGANFVHILASSLLAFGYAESISTRRFLPLTISLIFATLIHFWYNVLVIYGNYVVHVLPLLWSVFPIVLIEIGHLKLHHATFTKGRR